MALVRFGGGVVQMSGSIGGDTFARNRSGNYSRARTKPTNPNTALQQKMRAALAFLTTRWGRDLSVARRAAWNLYGDNVAMKNRLGEVIKLTGFNHYIRSNSFRKAYGYALVDDGPIIFELPAKDPTYAVTVVAATKTMSHVFDNTLAWANEAGGFMFLSCGQPQNRQRNFFAGPWKVTGCIPGDAIAAPASPHDTNTLWEVGAGQHVWSYARISQADGRLSEVFRADTFCAA